MPTYGYECTKCKHCFEVFQSISDKPKSRCPKCKAKLHRLITGGSGMIFKGSGFYSTDYKKTTNTDKTSTKSESCTPSKACDSCPKNNTKESKS